MNNHLKPEDRLAILLDDERFCIVCERKFNGRQVEIRCFSNGKYELRCPTDGCGSGSHQWVYPGTPLVSDIVDPDWWHASDAEPRKISESTGRVGFAREQER